MTGCRIGDRERVQEAFAGGGAAVVERRSRPSPTGLASSRRHRTPSRSQRACGTFRRTEASHRVLAAGVFGTSAAVVDLDSESWRGTMDVNVDANVRLLRELHPLLPPSPVGGRVVVVGSRTSPRRAAAPPHTPRRRRRVTHSRASRRWEWAPTAYASNRASGRRLRHGAWTPSSSPSAQPRAGSRREYRRRNQLGLRIKSADVARAVVALCDERPGRRRARRSRSTAATSA